MNFWDVADRKILIVNCAEIRELLANTRGDIQSSLNGNLAVNSVPGQILCHSAREAFKGIEAKYASRVIKRFVN